MIRVHFKLVFTIPKISASYNVINTEGMSTHQTKEEACSGYIAALVVGYLYLVDGSASSRLGPTTVEECIIANKKTDGSSRL